MNFIVTVKTKNINILTFIKCQTSSNLLVYNRNIFSYSLDIFGHLRYLGGKDRKHSTRYRVEQKEISYLRVHMYYHFAFEERNLISCWCPCVLHAEKFEIVLCRTTKWPPLLLSLGAHFRRKPSNASP